MEKSIGLKNNFFKIPECQFLVQSVFQRRVLAEFWAYLRVGALLIL